MWTQVPEQHCRIVKSTAATFPSVTAPNLAGRNMRLPADFAGDLNLVLIAFQREQQADIDTWLEPGRRLTAAFPHLACYELPVIGKMNPIFRRFIAEGMRSGIPDPTARATTITLHLDKPGFEPRLALSARTARTPYWWTGKEWFTGGRKAAAPTPRKKDLRERIATRWANPTGTSLRRSGSSTAKAKIAERSSEALSEHLGDSGG